MRYGVNKINTRLFTQQLGWLGVIKEFNSILGVQGSNFTNDIVVINDGILIEYSIPN
jgi:hypothetical protein